LRGRIHRKRYNPPIQHPIFRTDGP
jgi:hypothetical protein